MQEQVQLGTVMRVHAWCVDGSGERRKVMVCWERMPAGRWWYWKASAVAARCLLPKAESGAPGRVRGVHALGSVAEGGREWQGQR